MQRFTAIEGLRAWLAWAVVFWHLVQALGFAAYKGAMSWFQNFGDASVMVFIAISGFVITGLVLNKAEPYPQYILRRVFRIFPVYLVIFTAALFLLPYGIAAANHVSWIGQGNYYWNKTLAESAKALADNPADQLALHYSLLQGVVPDSIWPRTSVAVLGPAWSLSLEWQFYLVAPAFVWLMASPRYRMAAIIASAGLGVAFRYGAFGDYLLPSAFPAAGYVFLVGIASRMWFDCIRAVQLGPEIIPLALGLGLVTPDLLWLGVWTSALVYLARREAWRFDDGRAHWLGALMDKMFASPVAAYLGARSYSVYLVHVPIIMLGSWLLTTYADLAGTPERIALAAGVLFGTLLVSDLLYRFVERPMITLGAWLAARLPAGASLRKTTDDSP